MYLKENDNSAVLEDALGNIWPVILFLTKKNKFRKDVSEPFHEPLAILRERYGKTQQN